MRFTVAFLSALALGAASLASSAAQAAVPGPAAGAKLDLVAPAIDSSVAFQTYPNARCVFNAAGTRKTMTVYADDHGSLRSTLPLGRAVRRTPL